MIDLNVVAIATREYLIVVGAVLFWFWCYREFRDDNFRQRMFALRDELFDYAADGNIPFSHPAYAWLRSTMNGIIRFSHRATLTRLFLRLSSGPAVNYVQEDVHRWEEHLKTLPRDVQDRLKEVHGRMIILVVQKAVTGSLVFMLIIGGLSIILGLIGLAKQFWEAIANRLPGIDILEAEARASATQ